MARKKYDAMMRRALDDIAVNFHSGDRYRSIRALAKTFDASLQTVQSAVHELCERGVLRSEGKTGLFVLQAPKEIDIRGRTVLLSSAKFDPRFTNAFLSAIQAEADRYEMKVVSILDEEKDENTIRHGEALIKAYREHEASGLIAIAYRNVELAFYHALIGGCVLITDVSFPNLPHLPSVQTDNRRHSIEAARKFSKLGKREILVASYWEQGNVRHASFEAEFKRLVPGGKVKYVHLVDETSPADIYIFLRHFDGSKGIFMADYAANHTICAFLMANGIPPKDNFIVYDCETDVFRNPGMEPVEAAAPGLNVLGSRLASRLIGRIADGIWSEPLQELI